MTVRVVVVDDSGFFRRRIVEILEGDSQIEVVGTACDGLEGVKAVESLKPDVVTMDVEMPVMDGITAVRRIMSRCPTPVLMFSSLTCDGATATLDALDAGAMDFMPKNLDDIAADRETAKTQLRTRILALSRQKAGRTREIVRSGAALQPGHEDLSAYEMVLIGISTGGPAALPKILSQLPASYPLPILIIQHMPASFTPAFAERLDRNCAISVRHAHEGDRLQKGTAYIAPGGEQMIVERKTAGIVLKLTDSAPDQLYKPCVDITFESVANTIAGKALAVIMTGMGADGCEGARKLKGHGATIWAQDEQSSVVYGMPMAVAKAGLADRVLSLKDIATGLGGVA